MWVKSIKILKYRSTERSIDNYYIAMNWINIEQCSIVAIVDWTFCVEHSIANCDILRHQIVGTTTRNVAIVDERSPERYLGFFIDFTHMEKKHKNTSIYMIFVGFNFFFEWTLSKYLEFIFAINLLFMSPVRYSFKFLCLFKVLVVVFLVHNIVCCAV